MKWELFWKIYPIACQVMRWITRKKPTTRTLLVVEDDGLDAEILEGRLRKLGYECEIASSGEVAEGLVQHTFYPVAFVDMRLPGMSGEAVVRLLSKKTPSTNIVIVCGEPADLVGLPPDEGVMFLQKPPSLRGLAKLMKMVGKLEANRKLTEGE